MVCVRRVMRHTLAVTVLIGGTSAVVACGDGATTPDVGVRGATETNAPTIGEVPAELASMSATFTKHTDAFGVDIIATPATPDEKIFHARRVMAEYLDNDEDGVVDDPRVVGALERNRAVLLMSVDDELERSGFDFSRLEFLAHEPVNASRSSPLVGFDESLEAIHRLLFRYGWSEAHPTELGTEEGTVIAHAMDLARNGHFDENPETYSWGAWYTPSLPGCDYACAIRHYAWYAHAGLLGALVDHDEAVDDIWRPASPAEVRRIDRVFTQVFDDESVGLPQSLPDGHYDG